MDDPAALYRDAVEAVAVLVGDLDEAALATPVPATPEWTVRQLLAHLAGGAADAVGGRMDGAPGPGWTARHVEERSDVPVADLVAELRSNVEAIGRSVVDNPRPALVWDISVHLADVHEALGPTRPAPELWRPVVQALAPWRLGELPGEIHVDGAVHGAGGPRVDVSDYELFRAVFSRRSRSQVRTWAAPLGDEAVEGLGIFGPRDDDQPVPSE